MQLFLWLSIGIAQGVLPEHLCSQYNRFQEAEYTCWWRSKVYMCYVYPKQLTFNFEVNNFDDNFGWKVIRIFNL